MRLEGWAAGLMVRDGASRLLTMRSSRTFGRTMAQPIRSSGWRPLTYHSNARGTSGTRPGKRFAMSGGGVPTVSDARQTTTPPVSANFAELSHGVRSRRGIEQQMRTPPVERDQRRNRGVAGHRHAAADRCAARNCHRSSVRSCLPAARSALRQRSSTAGTAWSRSPQGPARAAPAPRPRAIAAAGADRRDRPSRRSRRAPTSAAQCPSRR